MKHPLTCLLFFTLVFTSCASDEKKQEARRNKYETSKLSLEEIEKKSPLEFLSVKGANRKNLIGQTVVRGKIHSTANIVAYKDVDIKLSFYSKTGALLQEDQETVYETILPGASVSFKSKYFSPKGTDSIALKVMSAKY